MFKFLYLPFLIICILTLSADEKSASDEFKIKREAKFEFVQKPKVSKKGDNYTIEFETAGFCDATIVIENANKTIRHLASGVLGGNAPEPFQKNTKKQTIIWDGKDNLGVYIDDLTNCRIRVSLGLKPQFERNVLWSPYKRLSKERLVLASHPEGMLVYDGTGVDSIKLFDHDGSYKRTVYPFPSTQINQIKGLTMHTFPQDGKSIALKTGHIQATLLTSGSSSNINDIFGYGYALRFMGVHKDTLLIGSDRLNWLSANSGANKYELTGPRLYYDIKLQGMLGFVGGQFKVTPRSVAFSPDGKYAYFTCYNWDYPYRQKAFNIVTKIDLEKNEAPMEWKGSSIEDKTGEAPNDFKEPTSVACDSKGHVYVCDYFNDRIQVFKQDGNLVKTIKFVKPFKIQINQKDDSIYVFSWPASSNHWPEDYPSSKVPSTLTVITSLDESDKRKEYSLPLHPVTQNLNRFSVGWSYDAEVDFNTGGKPIVWVMPYDKASTMITNKFDMKLTSLKLYTMEDKELVLLKDSYGELEKKTINFLPPPFGSQRMSINKKTGMMYLYELDVGVDKNFSKITEWDPNTGKFRIIPLPCMAEDICFDMNGLIYLRVDQGVIRFDFNTWKEVPWDYGEEYKTVRFQSTIGGKAVQGISVLPVPGERSSPFWHLSGMEINTKGHLAVSTYNGSTKMARNDDVKLTGGFENKKYQPTLYPGRFQWGEIHVYDKHGKIFREDGFPGIGHMNGVNIDKDDNLYVMVGATRLWNGKKYDDSKNDVTDTLVKTNGGKSRVITNSLNIPVPLMKDLVPKRSADVAGTIGVGGEGWFENVQWMYGGVGSNFINQPAPSCNCWNSRMTLDLLGRTFAPELRHCSVAVLDTAGNLILRLGQYGNIDEGVQLIADPELKNPRSIGGDEVSLFYAPYVATETDKRLYIADSGNGRIISVKLNYEQNEEIKLADIK